MFGRRTDFSWLLILLLVGIFVLSLKVPRQWERIARPTPFVLSAHNSNHAKELTSIASGQTGTSLDVFHAIKPAGHIASNNSPLANSVSLATDAVPVAVVAPVAVASAPQTEVVSAVSVEQPIHVAVAAEAPKDTPADNVAVSEPSSPPQATLPTGQGEAKVVASTTLEKNDAVQVLPAVPASESGPSLGSANAGTTELEVRRLPPAEISIAQDQPPVQANAGADAVRLPALSATPEPAVAAESSPPNSETVANPVRPVVPEPQPVVEQNSSANPQPALPQASAAVIAESPQSAAVAKPAIVAEAAPPAPSPAVAEAPIKAIGRAWEEPAHLLLQLQDLQKHEVTRGWATEASIAVHKLGPAISIGAAETAEILQRLEQLAGETPSLLTKVDDENLAQNLSLTSYGLERRITIWKQIGRMGGMARADVPVPAVDPRRFNKCLNDIDQLTENTSEGHAWRKYLLIESLHDWAARHRNADERLPHDLAQQILNRMNQMSVTTNQRQFLTTGPMAALHQEMLRHTAEPLESNRLLQHLEAYETSGLPSDARVLARDCQLLSVSSGAAQRELGDRIEMYYRNANIRIAVTADLLNRWIPKRDPEFAPVKDTIQGADVRGESLMASEVTVRMLPDPHHVRLALEINGEVASLTRSTSGPATFFSDSESTYIARKPIEISLRGINAGPTEVAVDNKSQLKGIHTDFDNFPIVNRFARNMAQQQHDEKMPAAEAEVRGKIAAKARDRVDRETAEQIAAAAKRLHDEVLGPMDSLVLDPMMVAAETTDKRFSMRVRLAGPDQLGGHTPRPQAPSDSLASVQIHESMLNNMLERLELNGQTFDLAGLGRRISERFHRFQPKPVDPDQEDVKITFAAKDAVRVRCNDGRLEITLAIARLSKGSRKWKDFQVRAFYRPAVQGRSVDLAREGIVQLIGARTNAAAQIALRGVFSKVFSQKEPIHATPESFIKNPKLNGVAVTQLVIDDGWIGAAIGPQRTVTAQAGAARR